MPSSDWRAAGSTCLTAPFCHALRRSVRRVDGRTQDEAASEQRIIDSVPEYLAPRIGPARLLEDGLDRQQESRLPRLEDASLRGDEGDAPHPEIRLQASC